MFEPHDIANKKSEKERERDRQTDREDVFFNLRSFAIKSEVK